MILWLKELPPSSLIIEGAAWWGSGCGIMLLRNDLTRIGCWAEAGKSLKVATGKYEER